MTNLRLRVLPRFPARISGTNGFAVEREDVDLVVKPDYEQLAVVPAVPDSNETFFQAWTRNIDTYNIIPFEALVSNIQDVIIGENLAAIDELSTSANKGIYYTAEGEAATYEISEFTRTISGAVDDAAFRASLGLGTAAVADAGDFATSVQGGLADSALQPVAIGSSVQAYSANLDTLAGVASGATGRDVLAGATVDDVYTSLTTAVWDSGTTRTMKERSKWKASLLDWDADPTGANDSTAALKAMIAEGVQCEITKGRFVTSEALLLKTTGQRIVGQGRGYGYGRPDFFAKDWQHVSTIIGAGTFDRRVLTRRKYRASGSDPTDDAMSAIFEVHADGVSIEDFAIWLNCDYTDLSHTNLGDDIDIGVFRGGRPGFNTRNIAIIGHFRKTRLLHDYTRALNLPELLDPDGNPLPQGASGETFAGGDGWNHHNVLMWGWGSGFTEYGPIHPGGNYYDEATGAVSDQRGASGDSDGRFSGRCASYVTHQSGRRLVDPTGYGSALTRNNMEAEPDFFPAGIDIDGWAGNSSSTTTGRGQIRNMIFGTMRVSSASAFRTRLRDCDQIHFEGITWIESGDYPSTASSWKDSAGVEISINDYVNVTYGHISTDSTKTGSVFADDVVGGIFQTWVASGTSFTGSQADGDRLEIGVDSGSAVIADDTVLTLTPPVNGGWMRLSYSPVNAPIFAHSALFYYDCGSSLLIQGVTGAVGSNVTLATTDLTDGTSDGVDGNTNVSVQSGVVKIKNRTGGALYRWRWL